MATPENRNISENKGAKENQENQDNRSNRQKERDEILAFLERERNAYWKGDEGSCTYKIGTAFDGFIKRLKLSEIAPDTNVIATGGTAYYVDKAGTKISIIGIDGAQREIECEEIVIRLKR